MLQSIKNYSWNATAFFADLTKRNRFAIAKGFRFCKVSGLDGFEEALAAMQQTTAFVCVSDISQGYTELNNTPQTRRVKTVFMAMRHAIDDMNARERCMDAMRELYRIKRYLIDENLSVELLFVDLEELRFQDGYAREGKKGSHRMERIPKGLNRIVAFHSMDDYAQLLPDQKLLPSPFTAVDFKKAWKTTERNASIALLMLTQFGILERIGKKGHAYLYKIAGPYRTE